MRDSPSDPGATRRLILILAICGFASTFAIRSADPLIGVIARDLGSEPGRIALLSTAFALPYAFIQPILGPVGDALGKERIMKVCLAALAATLAASALTPDSGTLFALRVVSGGAAGGVIPLVLATIGDRVEMARRQVAISRFLVAVIIGQLSGASVSGFLAEWIGWRGVFALAAVTALAGCLAAILGLTSSVAASGPFKLSVALARYRTILGLARARALFAFVFVEGLIVFGILPYIAPLLETRAAGGPFEAGLIIAGFAGGGLVYSALVVLLLRYLGLARMLVASGACAAAAYLVFAMAGHWTIDAAAMVALGAGFYMLHNSLQTQVTEVAPEARASAVSLHAFSFFCGQAIGPVALGLGLGLLGQGWTMVLCALAALGLGLTAARVLAPTYARSR